MIIIKDVIFHIHVVQDNSDKIEIISTHVSPEDLRSIRDPYPFLHSIVIQLVKNLSAREDVDIDYDSAK